MRTWKDEYKRWMTPPAATGARGETQIGTLTRLRREERRQARRRQLYWAVVALVVSMATWGALFALIRS